MGRKTCARGAKQVLSGRNNDHFNKLTGSEVRVLHAVAETGGVPEIAAVLGISESTVRRQLNSLFDKTGTQADLVKLVATHASPFHT